VQGRHDHTEDRPVDLLRIELRSIHELGSRHARQVDDVHVTEGAARFDEWCPAAGDDRHPAARPGQ
jgi:hypothetical protein